MIDTIRHTIVEITPRQIRHYKKFKKVGNGVYIYDYQNIHFVYYLFTHTLLIFTNTHTLLNKKNILLNDYGPYMDRLRRILNVVVGQPYKLTLNRIDFYQDIIFDTNEQLNDVCKLIQLYPQTYKRMKASKQYETSTHLHTKRGQTNLNIYNKNVESGYDQKYDRTLRIEIQNRKALLLKQEELGVKRRLKNYWNKDTFQKLYLDFLIPFLYEGTHYKLEKAQRIVGQSSYTPTIKNNLIQFLREVNLYGMETTKHLHSKNTISRNIGRLEEIGVNPITLPTNCKSDYIPSLLELVQNETKKLFQT